MITATIRHPREVHSIPHVLQCAYVRNTTDCSDAHGIFNYIQFLYCDVNTAFFAAGVFLCVILLFMFFAVLATAANEFFCPCLKVISRLLGLSQNVAGVTVVALGNGAPDIFSSLASAAQERPELVLGELFGGGMFVTSMVVGMVCVTSPFKLMERPFLRDVIFYLAAVYWAYYAFSSGTVSLVESSGFLALYMVYILVVLIGRCVYSRMRVNEESDITDSRRSSRVVSVTASSASVYPPPEESSSDTNVAAIIQAIRGLAATTPTPIAIIGANGLRVEVESGGSSINVDAKSEVVVSTASQQEDEGAPLLGGPRKKKCVCPPLLMNLLQALSPLDKETWAESSWFSRITCVMKTPLVLILKLTVPVVNEDEELQGWCRPLNSLHCLTLLVFVAFASGCGTQVVVASAQVWVLALVIGLYLGTLVFFITDSDHSPRFHAGFACLGFVGAVTWIYLLATEIVCLLKALGVAFNLSDVLLGLTVLAWGNSVGDMVTNVSVARQGFPRMGISACFGGPLFNLLVGMGVSFTVSVVKKGAPVTVRFGTTNHVLVTFLMCSLLSSLIFFPMVRFEARRGYGIYLFLLYATFLLVVVLAQLGVLPFL